MEGEKGTRRLSSSLTSRRRLELLERGLGSPPEPPGVTDLGDGGEDHSGEDGEGDERHGEAVEGRDGAEGDEVVAAAEEESEVEEERESDVEGDGGEEEPPPPPPLNR
ncbi:hypothetical protein CsSME_00037148 [Camellia sinensis var. sinensis]